MSHDDLQLLRDFRAETPEPDAETAGRIYRLATVTSPRRRRRRRRPLRLAVAGAAVVAIALGVLSTLPGDEPSGDTILHMVVAATTAGRPGVERTESWTLNQPPYDRRQVEGGGRRLEEATANGRPQVYDPRSDTILSYPEATEFPSPRPPQQHGQRLLDLMRAHLASGEVSQERAGGSIRFESPHLNASLVVDAETFRPLEWSSVSDDGIVVTSRIKTYELLPATAANRRLLSLSAQHPGARTEAGLELEGVGG
jgi:hypothetical protein